MLTSPREEGLPTTDVRQRDCQRAGRIGGVLQRECKGPAQSLEKIAINLSFKSENQVLLPLIL